MVTCDEDSYITSLNIRFESVKAIDDTALNGIRMKCRYSDWTVANQELTVYNGLWGNW